MEGHRFHAYIWGINPDVFSVDSELSGSEKADKSKNPKCGREDEGVTKRKSLRTPCFVFEVLGLRDEMLGLQSPVL